MGRARPFVTAASQIVMPVVRIDDRPVGDGAPGPVATALRESFHAHAERISDRLAERAAPIASRSATNFCLHGVGP